MAESLNVIALISGGKDSFYSLLHCLQHGHKVVALGNLYPAPSPSSYDDEEDKEHDLNSFMYQTVGHTVIPLYEQATGIPLYRQQILGTAVQTGLSYGHDAAKKDGDGEQRPEVEGEDETESLVPLLTRIMAAHPEVNALSTGAILSTYQRTRIESVALRLGLVPLAYLWQYPILPPGTQSSLLSDMAAVGLDARIVKVASGGLDESFLWKNVADPTAVSRIERGMKRFGMDGDGAVLGEGGEFETLVVDGPRGLFKGSIEVEGEGMRVVREGGGAAWLKILSAKIVMKEATQVIEEACRVPDLLETRFKEILDFLNREPSRTALHELEHLELGRPRNPDLFTIPPHKEGRDDVLRWTVKEEAQSEDTISQQATKLIKQIQHLLHASSLQPTSIISTLIILRSMSDFSATNKACTLPLLTLVPSNNPKVYGALFTAPNPPARVTISSGPSMPKNTNIIIHLRIHAPNFRFSTTPPSCKALHVQSRSYWAPANIGPYSQAVSIPLPMTTIDNEGESNTTWSWETSIAGQIPLIPPTMFLPHSTINSIEDSKPDESWTTNFNLQTVLSLQHLVRIGLQMDVQWFTHVVAYFPSSSAQLTKYKAIIAAKAWTRLHTPPPATEGGDEEEENDLWEQKHFAGKQNRGGSESERFLPDWGLVEGGKREEGDGSPFWAAEVEELPRGAGVEWAAGLGLKGPSIKVCFPVWFDSS